MTNVARLALSREKCYECTLESLDLSLKIISKSSGQCGSIGWMLSHRAKGYWFDSQVARAHPWVADLVPIWGRYEK